MLRVVQVIRLGGRKQDLFHPLADQDARQEGIPPRPEGPQDIRHGLAQILDRARPLVDRAKRIDQHHLPVDPAK